MKIKIGIILLLALFGVLRSGLSQEIIYDTPYSTSPNDIGTDQYGNYIITGYENLTYTPYFWRSFIIKITPDFDTTVRIIDDTLNQLFSPRLLITQSNKYILSMVEGLENSIAYFDQLVIAVFDEDLNMLSFKRYDMSPLYQEVYMKFIQNSDGRIYGFANRGINDKFIVMEINEEGDTLRTKLLDSTPVYPAVSDVIESHNDTLAFIAFGDGFEGFSANQKTINVDTGFNYVYKDITFTNPSYYIQNVYANWLNDSIYMGTGFIPVTTVEKDLLVYKANANQNHEIVGTPLYISRPDTSDTPAVNTPTFVDLDHIYVGSWRGSSPGASYNGRYMVCMIDENLNLLGMKSLGKDGYQYDMVAMQATDDLGCLLTGTVHDNANAGEHDWDIFIRKIMPDEIVEVAEHTEDPYDSDYFVYPNPGKNKLNINTARKGVRLSITDINGKEVSVTGLAGTFLNTLDVSTLPSGTYILRFIDTEGFRETIKWIKSNN